MPSHSVLAIANEFLRRESLHQMKVQKLVYMAHGWTLAITGQPLIRDRIEAWDNGPVSPNLYRNYRYGRFDDKGMMLGDGGFAAIAELNVEEQGIIDAVWNRYRNYSPSELSDLTHQPNTPWSDAYVYRGQNAFISDEAIRKHYTELARAGRHT